MLAGYRMITLRKGEWDVAIGNSIGSNRLTLMGVMGLAGVIAPDHGRSLAPQRGFAGRAGLTLTFSLLWPMVSLKPDKLQARRCALPTAYLFYQCMLHLQPDDTGRARGIAP